MSYAYQWVRAASGGRGDGHPPAPQVVNLHGASGLTWTASSECGCRSPTTIGNAETLTSDATAAVIVAQVTVSFGAANYTATEGSGSATVAVVLDKDPHRTLKISADEGAGRGRGCRRLRGAGRRLSSTPVGRVQGRDRGGV